jgi:para-nitrobenzyl esterase
LSTLSCSLSGKQPTVADLTVQRFMVGYWTRLARTGNPNGASDPQWPVAASDAYLEINTTPSAKRGPDAAKCDFWDTVKMHWPHL